CGAQVPKPYLSVLLRGRAVVGGSHSRSRKPSVARPSASEGRGAQAPKRHPSVLRRGRAVVGGSHSRGRKPSAARPSASEGRAAQVPNSHSLSLPLRGEGWGGG